MNAPKKIWVDEITVKAECLSVKDSAHLARITDRPYRVTYHSLDDTWCRYFKTYNGAVRYMQQKAEYGYRTRLTVVEDM